jgi:hypothetical protein
VPSGFLGLLAELGGPLVAGLESIGRVCQQQNTKKRGIDTLRLNGRLLRCLADEASSLSQVGYWPKADIRGDTLDVRF